LFAALTVLCVLVVLEVMLRVAALASDRVSDLLSWSEVAPLPDPVLGTRPNPRRADHDPAGWRNAERPDRAVIVALGDSQTWGAGVSRDNAWPQRLEARTGYRTYNMANPGYGGAQYWLLTDEALALKPELVLVGFYAGNDLADMHRSLYRDRLAEELRSGDPAVTSEIEKADATRPDPGDGWLRTQRARGVSGASVARSGIVTGVERLKLYALVQATRHALERLKSDRIETDWERYVRRARGIERDLLFPFREAGVGSVLTPAARLPVVDLDDPRIAEALHATVDGFRRMRERCAGRAEVAVLLIPTKEYVYAERVRDSGAAAPEAYGRLVEAEERMWAEMRAALDAAGVAWIDTVGALREALARGENPYQMNWDGHPNVVGYDVIAAAAAHSDAVRRLASRGDRTGHATGESP
jgi:lysophospholipase L1-like esterase